MPKLSWISKLGYSNPKNNNKGGKGSAIDNLEGANAHAHAHALALNRSSSLQPGQKKYGYQRHEVVLKSSTYGLLKVDPINDKDKGKVSYEWSSHILNPNDASPRKKPISQADKIYSHYKATSHSRNEEAAETINTWELMQGVEDNVAISSSSGLNPNPNPNPSRLYERSSTFHATEEAAYGGGEGEGDGERKRRLDGFKTRPGSIKQMVNAFQQIIDDNTKKSNAKRVAVPVPIPKSRVPPGGDDRIVVYVTSLRGIRKTFEDCYAVKLILQGFRVVVDERDISIHAQFKKELNDVLGGKVTVPRLFVGGKYVGGAEEVRQLHETGELAKHLDGYPRHSSFKPCDGCGDWRFVPCLDCDGSRKLFSDDCIWVKCSFCNENGLIRCPLCC